MMITENNDIDLANSKISSKTHDEKNVFITYSPEEDIFIAEADPEIKIEQPESTDLSKSHQLKYTWNLRRIGQEQGEKVA